MAEGKISLLSVIKIEKEGKMKKSKSVLALGMCTAMLLGVFGAQEKSEHYEWKVTRAVTPPVTPPFKPGLEAMESVQNWVGEANAALEVIIKKLPNMKDDQVSETIACCKTKFANTYLKVPVLESEEHGVYIGWEEVIWTLKGIAGTYKGRGVIEIVAVPFAPPYSEKMKADFRAEIATELIFNPSTYSLRGCGVHRTDCTSGDC